MNIEKSTLAKLCFLWLNVFCINPVNPNILKILIQIIEFVLLPSPLGEDIMFKI